MAQAILFESYPYLSISKVKLYETPNCFTECTWKSISKTEAGNFYKHRRKELVKYAEEQGIVEYDQSKIKA